MACVNPIEVFFTGSFFFFLLTQSPKSLNWKLGEKNLTVIIILLGGRLERRKEIVDRFDFRYVDAMTLKMMRKDF
jgi:hypothetical protein